MKPRPALLLVLLVFVPSLAIRFHPVRSESFQHDAITSQMAARAGVAGNAWDTPEAFQHRRFHPPLLSYVIIANNRVFGDDPFRARVFSIIAGALACLAVAFAVQRVTGGGRSGTFGGLIAGWLLALLPVHLYVSRTANWDALYSLFSACSLLLLAAHVASRGFGRLAWAGVFGALSFLTSELGLSLLPAFAAVLIYDLRRDPPRPTIRRWLATLALAAVVITALWPAGVVKLDLLRSLRYRLIDSAAAERNLPWYGFYTALFEQAPWYTAVAALGALTALWLAVKRRSDAGSGRSTSHLPVALLPFAVYALTVVAISTRQRLVYVHHIADLFPALTVVAVSAFVVVARMISPLVRKAGVTLAFVVVALCAVSAANPDPNVVGPQEHPGYLGVRDFLQQHEGARTYYYYTYAMQYYLPTAIVGGGTERHWTGEKLEMLKNGNFDFVVCDWSMFDPAYPTVEAVAEGLAPEFVVGHIVLHRRTGIPVAWIFGRP
jgi:4-amino-4-deoxy-L-arabinose transferase-like glycosyltransferase